MKIVRDHWFRAEVESGVPPSTFLPCAIEGCGRPQAEHMEAVGEWRDPRHLFRPVLFRRAGRPKWPNCGRCDRRWGHSTHFGSKRNRSLWWDRWNGFWDVLRGRS